MSPSGPMLAQDIINFGQGIYLLIGILVSLFIAGIVGVALYVGIRVWIFQVRQRRSQEAYLKRTRRADGKAYPPRGGGICEKCGRIRKFVFFLPTGEMLCPECYEAWWPMVEAQKAAAEAEMQRTANAQPGGASRSEPLSAPLAPSAKRGVEGPRRFDPSLRAPG